MSLYTFDALNRPTAIKETGSTNSLAYDGAGRLRQTTLAGTITGLTYDGVELVAEYNSGGILLRRYVHGPGIDEPLVWYEVKERLPLSRPGCTRISWAVSSVLPTVQAPVPRSTATVRLVNPIPLPVSASAIPASSSSVHSICTTIRHASIRLHWAGSCRPIRSAPQMISICMYTSAIT